MNIDIKVTAKFVAKVIDEYCKTHVYDCAVDCPFDKIGVCTEQNSFNDIKGRMKRKQNESNSKRER